MSLSVAHPLRPCTYIAAVVSPDRASITDLRPISDTTCKELLFQKALTNSTLDQLTLVAKSK